MIETHVKKDKMKYKSKIIYVDVDKQYVRI